MESKVSIIKPFGPILFKANLPEVIINKLIKITDDLIISDNKENYGCALVGQIKEEVKISNELLKKEALYDIFQYYLKNYVEYCLKNTGDFNNEDYIVNVKLTDMWFNEMEAGEYNPAHYHTKCFVSSVLYLKIPKDRPKRNIECKDDRDGVIEFLDRSVAPDFLTRGTLAVQPEVGIMYMWPSSLLHTVYPFLGNEVRRSIAWNGTYQLIEKESGVVKAGSIAELN